MRREGFSILEVAIAVAILGLVIIFIIGMYTRLLNSNLSNTYRLTAMTVAQGILERLGEAFTGETGNSDISSLQELVSQLSSDDTLHYAMKVIINPQKLDSYGNVGTVSGVSSKEGGENLTYFVTVELRKVAENDQSYLVKVTVNVFWWWFAGRALEGADADSELYLRDFSLGALLSSTSSLTDSKLFNPAEISTSDFAKSRRNYVQYVRYYYVPKNI